MGREIRREVEPALRSGPSGDAHTAEATRERAQHTRHVLCRGVDAHRHPQALAAGDVVDHGATHGVFGGPNDAVQEGTEADVPEFGEPGPDQ